MNVALVLLRVGFSTSLFNWQTFTREEGRMGSQYHAEKKGDSRQIGSLSAKIIKCE